MDTEAIFAAVKQYLEAAHFEYLTEDTPDGYVLTCPELRIKNSLGTVSQTIRIWDTHMAIQAHCPIKAAPEHIGETAKFLALANYDLILGNFDLDVHTGEVLYRHFLECGGFEVLPAEVLYRHCPIPLVLLRQYGDDIAAVATGRSDAESAFAEAKEKAIQSGILGRS